VSLTARILEEAGIATVVIGSALDIVSHCGVPRYFFSDFPLGNPLGKPYDTDMQQDTLEQALTLLVEADSPGTIVSNDTIWSEDDSWKQNIFRADDSNREALAKMGEENRQNRLAAKTSGLARD